MKFGPLQSSMAAMAIGMAAAKQSAERMSKAISNVEAQLRAQGDPHLAMNSGRRFKGRRTGGSRYRPKDVEIEAARQKRVELFKKAAAVAPCQTLTNYESNQYIKAERAWLSGKRKKKPEPEEFRGCRVHLAMRKMKQQLDAHA